jgi:CO/xanthine dehydrogenase FAD-binding subunit
LKGKVASEKGIAEAARAAVKDAKPMRMNAYKVEITKTLVKRAISHCVSVKEDPR